MAGGTFTLPSGVILRPIDAIKPPPPQPWMPEIRPESNPWVVFAPRG